MSSSSSESSSSQTSSSLPKFDPFAVHPFTNCSVTQNVHNPSTPAHTKYAYAYSGRNGIPPSPQNQYPANTSSHSPPKSSSSSHTAGIFVPFRQDTSSPDLADVLKSKSPSKTSTATTSRA
ncbi:hypothetical protein D9619_006098 [Psilocybe cf. subviscida]|uniref:Uncharacterized protein n=1 Tax=Psilocybe cf. subviscida TaxID=2480587 RepID=A0A8H5EXW0_9AGAR|nr:hypothetical protein D9619_006098 [Psilocybe cf. subviscida]